MSIHDPVRFVAKNMRLDLRLIGAMVAPNSRVLDIGCGDGALIEHLFRTQGCDARGIEIDMAEVTRAVAHGMPVMHGDADNDLQHYPDNAFDYVVLSRTLQAVEKPREVLRQMLRIGTRAVVSFPNFGHWRLRWQLLTTGRMPMTATWDRSWYETPNIHPCTVRDFFVLCETEGYVVEDWLAVDDAGRRAPWRRAPHLANLFGEQAMFLLRQDANPGTPRMTQPPDLPVPTIDHVVVNVRDRLDEAAETYRRLGFTLTPRGHHSLGSMNHLAIFGTDYLELIAARPGDSGRPEIMAAPPGLNGLVFASEDAAATHAALAAAGVAATPPMQFTRPVALAGGDRDATFRTVHLAARPSGLGRLYFCQHLTRDLVWRDAWRHHANGVLGVARAVIAADDPMALGALFATMFGAAAVTPKPGGGCTLAAGLARFDVLTPGMVAATFGDAAPGGGGRTEHMVALTLRASSLDRAAAALAGVAGVRREPGRVIVPADAAFGTVLEFVA